jgi:hypothetical protein
MMAPVQQSHYNFQVGEVLCAFVPEGEAGGEFLTHRCTRCGYLTVPIPNQGQAILRNCDVLPSGERRPEPGTKLHEVLAEVGISGDDDCGCSAFAATMNAWGVEGCRANRQVIIQRLQDAAINHGWDAAIAAPSLLIKPWFNIVDPFGAIVDEAIRKACNSAKRTWGEVIRNLLLGPPL